jgi:ERCC4-related helicase
MKNLLEVQGNYHSTYAFVHQNNLENTATKVLGKDWKAEDDVNQIQEIINSLGIGNYSVTCNEHIDTDGDDIEVRKVPHVEGIHKAFKQLCTLYDVSDELENNGREEDANKMRDTLNKLGTFILSLKN